MMNLQDQFRIYLTEYFETVKSKNSQFSLRSLAMRAKLNPAALSQFLNGKRKFSPEMIQRIAADVGFTPDQLLILKSMGEAEERKDTRFSKKELRNKIQINLDHYYLVADWHYYAILSLAETSDFKNDPKWIAKRLNTSAAHVSQVIERLKKLGHFELKGTKLVLREVVLETLEDVPNTSLKKRHEENLEAAREAIYNVALDRRDYSFSTVAINPEQLPRAKKMIREFREKLLRTLEAGDKKEVYEVCFHLFPRSKSED
jgi:uncharacterized protein (TIGR02147 family)